MGNSDPEASLVQSGGATPGAAQVEVAQAIAVAQADDSQVAGNDSAEAVESEDGEAADVEEAEAASLPEDWAYDLMGKADPAQVALYDEAKAIVKAEAGYEGEMKKESRRFGDWYQIIFAPEELIDKDGQPIGFMKPRSFLVNMNERHVIRAGDFRRAKPFFDALVAAFPKKGASEQGRFVGEMASAVSTVAFGHSEYEAGNPEGDKPPYAPQVSERMDKFILEYDVSVGRGENVTYDRCRLTVLAQGISFSADQEE